MVRTFQSGRRATTPAAGDEAADAVTSQESDVRTERTETSGAENTPEREPDGLPAAPPLRTGDDEDGEDGDGGKAGRGGSGPAATRREPESGPAPSATVRRGVAAAFGLMLVAAVATGIWWGIGQQAESDRAAALESAQAAAVSLTSINFETAEDDVRKVVEESTGDFGGLFAQNLDSYISLVKESKVATQGEVTGAGIDRIDGSTARVVVAVKADVKNQSVPNGEPRFYRMVTELEKKDGEWLVSRVEFVP
ncbi:hypothetical protein FRP1_20840 [Pseudonocardia sp. EC080625-04]|uniref:hypothetical protein n=1 Tax=Pseudonocardia sp. EC080625-04 TaxID=1096868 RepID=UPI0006CB1F6C|nr:hypothetical protein [Pseudonocardia sp. EC080625-04]ALE74779.1 hypothetical protein FRP1_20840 [Pseudonocardia sp. EC080625-04]